MALIVRVGGMPWTKTGETQCPAQLGLLDKGRKINGLIVCNDWDLEPLDLLNGLANGCYQPYSKVIIVKVLIGIC